MRTSPLRIALALAAALAIVSTGGRAQAPLLVLSSNGVKAVLEELQPRSERLAGRPLAITFGTSASTRERIAAGEAFDLAILTTEIIDDLTKAGTIVRGSTAALGSSGIGIGVREGTLKPDVQTADALKHILLAVRSLTYASDGASRPSINRMLDTFGIADAMKPKTILEQDSIRAAARVVQGDADMVITLVSEILPIRGLALAGPLPEEFQSYVSFSAGIGSNAGNPEAARAVIAFLSGPGVAQVFKDKGIERR